MFRGEPTGRRKGRGVRDGHPRERMTHGLLGAAFTFKEVASGLWLALLPGQAVRALPRRGRVLSPLNHFSHSQSFPDGTRPAQDKIRFHPLRCSE